MEIIETGWRPLKAYRGVLAMLVLVLVIGGVVVGQRVGDESATDVDVQSPPTEPLPDLFADVEQDDMALEIDEAVADEAVANEEPVEQAPPLLAIPGPPDLTVEVVPDFITLRWPKVERATYYRATFGNGHVVQRSVGLPSMATRLSTSCCTDWSELVGTTMTAEAWACNDSGCTASEPIEYTVPEMG